MATPYSQIVGAQAIENVVSGERYGQVTDEAIKYVLGYYGEPAAPIDPKVMDRVMSLPRTEALKNWKPDGYEKSVEELRQEIGPELSDDDLLLKILIPGKPLKPSGKGKKTKRPPAPALEKGTGPISLAADFPTEFEVDVDGEVFNVKIAPVWKGASRTKQAAEPQGQEKRRERKDSPPGALLCGMAGLVLSIEVEVGDRVEAGDLVAVIEAMKMRRHVSSPCKGVVKEIRASVGEMVYPQDILMVVA